MNLIKILHWPFFLSVNEPDDFMAIKRDNDAIKYCDTFTEWMIKNEEILQIAHQELKNIKIDCRIPSFSEFCERVRKNNFIGIDFKEFINGLN